MASIRAATRAAEYRAELEISGVRKITPVARTTEPPSPICYMIYHHRKRVA
jgi:hypothetical protein